jgi:hypothetical protein
MKKALALIPILMLIVVVSGCTSAGLTINDFKAAIEALEIDGETTECSLESSPTLSYVYCGYLNKGVIAISSHVSSSEAQALLDNNILSLINIEDEFPELNRTYTFSEVSISGETITIMNKNENGEETKQYAWINDNFLFVVGFIDDNTNQNMVEAIIDIYQ